MESFLKIGIVGAGAVGGYFGGRLAASGLDVRFLARGGHLRAMKEKGLSIKSCHGDVHLSSVKVTDDPSEIGPCHVVLFCVKSYDTRGVAEAVKPMVGESTTVVSLQNGVGNEAVLGGVLGHEKVMGGVAFIGSRISEAGVILHTAAGSLAIGEMDGSITERGEMLRRLFAEAGVEIRLTDGIRKSMWQKMVWNCGFNAISALTGSDVAFLLASPDTRATIKGLMEEVVLVAGSEGVELPALLPEKTIANTEKQGEIRPSMLVDMEKGSRMEIEALNGAVCGIADLRGLSTPLNQALYSMVSNVNRRRGFAS